MSDARGDPPPEPDAAMPEKPQTSLHGQTIQPDPEDADAPPGANERTMEEEARARRHRDDA